MTARSIGMILAVFCVQTLAIATAFAGTGDIGGGANGIDGKPLDAYIKDPKSTLAFQRYLKPIFDHLDAISQEGVSKDAQNSVGSFSSYVNLKTWYFVPRDLKTLSNNTLGVSFGRNGTQQIAHHKKNSIWINTKIFDRMSIEDQATTLLHEVVMTIYFMRFKPLSDLCHEAILSGKCSMTPKQMKLADQIYPADTLRVLNADDYENIRPVTNWLMQVGAVTDYHSFLTMFLSHHFDRRFFNLRGGKGEELKMSRQEMISALNRAKYGRFLPTKCLTSDGADLGACSIELTKTKISFPAHPEISMDGLHIIVKNKSEVLVDQNMATAEETTLTPTIDPQSGVSISIAVLAAIVDPRTAKPGQIFRNIMLVMKHSHDSGRPAFDVDSMAVLPVVLVEVDISAKNPCTAVELDEEDIHERNLVLVSKKSELSPFLRLLATAFPPFLSCWK